ncbi:hypothetical protein CHU98_g9943 [Xylaria longipes]|nr:hypothetical protein CHU98_g9943 [Xylaria longipes]
MTIGLTAIKNLDSRYGRSRIEAEPGLKIERGKKQQTWTTVNRPTPNTVPRLLPTSLSDYEEWAIAEWLRSSPGISPMMDRIATSPDLRLRSEYTKPAYIDSLISSSSINPPTHHLHNAHPNHPIAMPRDPPRPRRLAIVRRELPELRAVLQRGVRGAAGPDGVQPVSVLPARVVELRLRAHPVDHEPARPGVLRHVRAGLPLPHRREVLRQYHRHGHAEL